MIAPEIAKNLAEIRENLGEAARRSGRSAEEVSLVAISKTQPVHVIREAFEAGQLLFGENRVQEALEKIPALPANIHWHLVGHLQKNKIRKALPFFQLLHGIDSMDLACAIDRIAADLQIVSRVLLEVNISGETSKFGFVPEQLTASLEQLAILSHIQIDGLMTMAPFHPHPENSRPIFSKLRELRDHLCQKTGLSLSVLSMGMSGDYQIAVEEGATLLRVGSALFGERDIGRVIQ